MAAALIAAGAGCDRRTREVAAEESAHGEEATPSAGVERGVIEARLREKIARVQSGAQARLAGGHDVSAIAALMDRADPLVRGGKLVEAERVVDQALALVGPEAGNAAPPSPDATAAAAPRPAAGGSAAGVTAAQREAVSAKGAASVRLERIPPDAAIVYLAPVEGSRIFTPGQPLRNVWAMAADGSQPAQLTFEGRAYDHVAVSPDRRNVAAAERHPGTAGDRPPRLWLFDLERSTEIRLAPGLYAAGEGGVDFDEQGFVYFSGREGPRASFEIYRARVDGSALERLTSTSDADEYDVAVSHDGRWITFAKAVPAGGHTEIWVARTDGSEARLVHRAGRVGIASAHDPEFSPDDRQLTFSVYNTGVPPNYRTVPGLGTAHDIWVVNLDGTGARRLTAPGPIAMIPSWDARGIVYTELSETRGWRGVSVVDAASGAERQLKEGAESARWIPSLRVAAP